ncbi:hypothetical protein [Kitasatospora sp. NPDC088134]|uniref:hypothetical protein n=1 Tax=Kitasatospora sp. NPDC088134 TaxID=3364071 RepID=UPI0037FD02D1
MWPIAFGGIVNQFVLVFMCAAAILVPTLSALLMAELVYLPLRRRGGGAIMRRLRLIRWRICREAGEKFVDARKVAREFGSPEPAIAVRESLLRWGLSMRGHRIAGWFLAVVSITFAAAAAIAFFFTVDLGSVPTLVVAPMLIVSALTAAIISVDQVAVRRTNSLDALVASVCSALSCCGAYRVDRNLRSADQLVLRVSEVSSALDRFGRYGLSGGACSRTHLMGLTAGKIAELEDRLARSLQSGEDVSALAGSLARLLDDLGSRNIYSMVDRGVAARFDAGFQTRLIPWSTIGAHVASLTLGLGMFFVIDWIGISSGAAYVPLAATVVVLMRVPYAVFLRRTPDVIRRAPDLPTESDSTVADPTGQGVQPGTVSARGAG